MAISIGSNGHNSQTNESTAIILQKLVSDELLTVCNWTGAKR